jgi:hypothetical protein
VLLKVRGAGSTKMGGAFLAVATGYAGSGEIGGNTVLHVKVIARNVVAAD